MVRCVLHLQISFNRLMGRGLKNQQNVLCITRMIQETVIRTEQWVEGGVQFNLIGSS